MRLCTVDGCCEAHHAHGYCVKHSCRFVRHGDPLGGGRDRGSAMEFVRSALSSVTEACVKWPFATIANGRPVMKYKGKTQYASRVILSLATGDPITTELVARHKCRTVSCINPRHLEWGTHSQNMMDRVRDGTDNRGERHPLSRLTNAQVLEIYKSKGRHVDLAKLYGVRPMVIGNIRNGKTWSHLTSRIEASLSGAVKA